MHVFLVKLYSMAHYNSLFRFIICIMSNFAEQLNHNRFCLQGIGNSPEWLAGLPRSQYSLNFILGSIAMHVDLKNMYTSQQGIVQ